MLVSAAPKERSANLNVRVPEGQWAMLKQIAKRLEVSVNSVVSILIEWHFAAARNQDAWRRAVEILREVIAEDPSDSLLLYDFDDSEWAYRLSNYLAMEEIGLVENLKYRRSSTANERWLCSFRLTETGRVVASVLDQRVVA